jgi:hypothetical protein
LYALSSSVDDTIFIHLTLVKATLDTQSSGTANDGVVGLIEHELTENIMGRTGELQQSGAVWGPTDFFRVNSSGQSSLKPSNGTSPSTAIYFSPAPGVVGPASSLQFNNSTSNGDYADWTHTSTSDPNISDPFGPADFLSNPGSPSLSSQLSPTDIDLLNVLGWNTSRGGGAVPSLSMALAQDTGASATDHLTSDPTLTGLAAANASVTLTENGNTIGAVAADTGGGWSFRPTLADGQHTISVRETYGAGLTATASISLRLVRTTGCVRRCASISATLHGRPSPAACPKRGRQPRGYHHRLRRSARHRVEPVDPISRKMEGSFLNLPNDAAKQKRLNRFHRPARL